MSSSSTLCVPPVFTVRRSKHLLIEQPFIMQVAMLLPLFVFCWYMYNWETDEGDQIPILPVEGEELPCNIKGPRLLREANFLQSLEKKLTGAGANAA